MRLCLALSHCKNVAKTLTPTLQNFIGPMLSQFLEQALEMAYMCGFVVRSLCARKGRNSSVRSAATGIVHTEC